jgi:hypothetical protein
MLAKRNSASKILCCFCGDKVIPKDIESHINKCKRNLECEVKDVFRLPIIYEGLFSRIKEDNFKLSNGSINKEKFTEEFNLKAESLYKDFEKKRLAAENMDLYQEKMSSIPRENFLSSNIKYDIENLVKDSLDIFLMYIKLKLGGTPLKEIYCFLCGMVVNFWEFEPHLRNCSKSYEYDKEVKIILQKPNFNIIAEALKEKEKPDADENYIEYLIKEFNSDSEKIYTKIYFKCSSIKNQARDKITSSSNMTASTQKILVRRLTDKKNLNSNLKISTTFSIRCYICGDFHNTEAFQIHYLKCKSEAPLIQLGNKKEFSEFGEFMNKIITGVLNQQDVEKYNSFAETIFWDVVCKTCSICLKKYSPICFERHFKACEEKMQQEMNIYPGDNISAYRNQRIRYSVDFDQIIEPLEKRKMRKKSMDDIRNYDIKQVRNNIKYYFI